MMKLMRYVTAAIVLLFSLNAFAAEKLITIVHTNDLHSHFQGFPPEIDYRPFDTVGDKTLGGWARVASVISDVRQKRDNPVLVLDAGDFSMGGLFHMLTREEAFELRLLKAMGYDAVTLGNHEFDFKPAGLAAMLRAAKANGGLPQVVFASAVFDPSKPELKTLREAFAEADVRPYVVLSRGGLKIGIFGLFGKSAMEFSPFAKPLTFSDPIKTAAEMTRILRDEEKVDLVICLSHGGVHPDPKHSEDEILAKEVKGIDVIISGHTHTKLDRPIVVGGTIIVQAWCYARQVGILDLAVAQGRVKLINYKPVVIDSAIRADAGIHDMIESFKHRLDLEFLSPMQLSYDQVIAETGWDLRIAAEESPLGNLLADSIRWAVNRADADPDDPQSIVRVAVESNGLIRDDLIKGMTGKITVGDLVRTFPMGIGMDDTMGYPLISFYLYGYEIKRAMEILTSVRPLKHNDDYYLQVSGIKFVYNPRRMFFDRVTSIEIGSDEEGYRPLDYSKSNKELYRVAANLYNATFLKMVGRFTFSFLEIIPKDRRGQPIDDLPQALVDADKTKPGVQELKQWLCLIDYVRSFKDLDGNGLPYMPEKYSGLLGRIVEKPGLCPADLLSKAEKPTLIALAVICVIVFVLIGCPVLIVRNTKKKKRNRTKF
ncbi:MAG: bifunctional metallophosphatase/5'-nucleotidase [Smithella sp.]|nr:bifunctional metallophosphatase/5'-nucleotidase [Smithella sp.]